MGTRFGVRFGGGEGRGITAPVKLTNQRARQMTDMTSKIFKYVRPCQEKVKRNKRIFDFTFLGFYKDVYPQVSKLPFHTRKLVTFGLRFENV